MHCRLDIGLSGHKHAAFVAVKPLLARLCNSRTAGWLSAHEARPLAEFLLFGAKPLLFQTFADFYAGGSIEFFRDLLHALPRDPVLFPELLKCDPFAKGLNDVTIALSDLSLFSRISVDPSFAVGNSFDIGHCF